MIKENQQLPLPKERPLIFTHKLSKFKGMLFRFKTKGFSTAKIEAKLKELQK